MCCQNHSLDSAEVGQTPFQPIVFVILYNSDLHWQLHVCRFLGTCLKSVQYVVLLLRHPT